jgi:tripartite-type tricarboxylate transporter receptor subunit TctC
MRYLGAALGALTLAGGIAAGASAETVADFYRDKTITVIIGTGTSSGAVEQYPRTLAPIIRKYIPGNPNIVVSNMPGAGGIKAANYIYSIAPQDGTVWGFITRGFVLAPLLKLHQAEFDPTKFNWIASPARSVSVGEVWTAATPVRTIQDAMKEQVVVGGTSPGQDTGVFPSMLNRFVGTKFKVITGYKSSGEVDLAMEKGEVQGKIGVTWTSLNSGRTADWVKNKTVTVLVQFGLEKAADIPSSVPVAVDLAKTPADRQALEVLCAPTSMGYPSFMGPKVPKERVAAIRTAYAKALKDPDFLAAAKHQRLTVDPIFADELERVVKRAYSSPASAVARAREVVPTH